jgi:hypothetical protein
METPQAPVLQQIQVRAVFNLQQSIETFGIRIRGLSTPPPLRMSWMKRCGPLCTIQCASTPGSGEKRRLESQSALRSRKSQTVRAHTVSAQGEDKKGGRLTSADHCWVASGSSHVAQAQGGRPTRSRLLLDTEGPSPKLQTAWLLSPPPPRFLAPTQPRRSAGTLWA